MQLSNIFLAALLSAATQALLHMNPSPGYRMPADSDRITKNMAARQTDIPEPTSCNQPSTAYHVAVTCTPIVGVGGAITTALCGGTSTTTVTGCDVSDRTTTTATTATITAECDANVCANNVCNANSPNGTSGFLMASFTSGAAPATETTLEQNFGNSKILKTDDRVAFGNDSFGNGSSIEFHQKVTSAKYDDTWLWEWSQVDPEVELREGEGHQREYKSDRWRRDGRSSSRVRAFEDKSFNMGVKGLRGCTSVIVVSRRGVWMSHIWEQPTFNVGIQEMWDTDVTYGLYRGDDSGEFPGLDQFSRGPGNLFVNDEEDGVVNELATFIVTPANTEGWEHIRPEDSQTGHPDRTQWLYPNEVMNIGRSLEAAFPVIPIVAPYRKNPGRWNEGQLRWNLQNTGLGKVIVSYYPSIGEAGCGDQKAHYEVRTYAWPEPASLDDEWEALHMDTWVAFEKQWIPVDPDAMVERDIANGSCKPTPSSSSSKATTTIPRLTQTPKITSCSVASFTSPVSGTAKTYTNCVCNDNQSGWPYTTTAASGAKDVICYKEGDPIVTISTIPSPTPRPEAPDITSCSLNQHTLTYSSTVDGTVRSEPSQVNVCACNDGQKATPFTVTALDQWETILCNKRLGGPTVTATVFALGPSCTPTINTPFRPGICTLNMTQSVSWLGGIVNHQLFYSAWDGSDVPPDAPDREKETAPASLDLWTFLDRCDTGFPFVIGLHFNVEPSDVEPSIVDHWATTGGNLTNLTSPNVLVYPEFASWSLSVHAGDTDWVSRPQDKGPFSLPYCKLGKWDGTRRAMDCHWEC